MAQTQNYDLIIAGGGTVGCLLALSLKSQQMNIAIVEAKPYTHASQQALHPGFDARSIALSHQSAGYLKSLGLERQLEKVSTAIKQIKVTDQGHLGQCLLEHHQQSVEALGYVVTQQQLGAMLYQPLQDDPNIHWYCPDSIADVRQSRQHIDMTLASGADLSAPLLVVADGGKSNTAAMLGLEAEHQDYQQVAVVANIQTDHPHHFRAYERFTPEGPLALLPNTEQTYGLVWSLNADNAQAYAQMSDAQFLHQLQQAFGYSVGRFLRLSRRDTYPLTLTRLRRQWAHRAVVIGNAAHTLHPIAGQGFNLGLRDAECLSSLLSQAIASQSDPGCARVLQGYCQQRFEDQRRVINSTDALVRFFSNAHWPLVCGRNLGLVGLQVCPPLRFKLAQSAMGYGGVE